MSHYTISAKLGWRKTLAADSLAEAVAAAFGDKAVRVVGTDHAATVYEGHRVVATAMQTTDPERVCGYCGGDVEHREGEGYFHTSAGERIDPKTISVGDFASLAHNNASRVNPADVITREEYDGDR